jgi:hypothetical protein
MGLASSPVNSAISGGDTLISAQVDTAPAMTGTGTDPAWAAATPLTLTTPGATLKSVFTGGRVYFLATVPDTTASFTGSAWSLAGTGTQATATTTLQATSVSSFTIVNGGSSYSGALTCTVVKDPADTITTTATCTAHQTGGVIDSVTVSPGGAGSGYHMEPTVTVTGAGGGTGFKGTVNLAATGLVTAATITQAGTGYTAVPACTVTGGGGTGATCTATIGGGAVSGVTVTSGNSDYTTVPTITLGPPTTGSTATATAVLAKPGVNDANVFGTSYTVTNAGTGYPDGTGACTVVNDPADTTGTGATCTGTFAGGSLTAITVTNPGSNYSANPHFTFPGGTTAATATGTLKTTSIASLTLTYGGSGYVSAPAVTIAPPASGTTALATSTITGGVVTGLTLTNGGSGYDYLAGPPTVTISQWARVQGQNQDRLGWMWSMGTPGFDTSGCGTKCHAGDSTSWLADGTADLWSGKAAQFLPVTTRGETPPLTVDPNTHAVTAGKITFTGFSDDNWVGPNTPTGGIHPDGGNDATASNVVAATGAPKYIKPAPANFVDAMTITQSDITGGSAVLVSSLTPAALQAAWKNYTDLKAVVPESILMNAAGSEGPKGPSGSRSDVIMSATWKDGVWTYEYSRALDTGNPAEDVIFSPGSSYGSNNGPYDFGLSYADNASGAGHLTSGLLKLIFQPTAMTDTTPPTVTGIQPNQYDTVTSASTVVYANFSDNVGGSGINTGTAVIKVDSVPLSGCTVTATSISCTATGLTNGKHDVEVDVKDNAGNLGQGYDWFTVNTTGTVGDRYYYTPWYDSTAAAGLQAWIVMSNQSNHSITAEIVAGGVSQGNVTIPAGNVSVKSWPDLRGGPVYVRIPNGLTNGDKLTVSERTTYKKSFNETNFLDSTMAATAYAWSWYDNSSAGMNGDWIAIANVDSDNAQVEIYVGANLEATKTIAPGAVDAFQINPAMMGGPVKVVSTNGKKIIATQRTLYYDSFNEVFGNPIT